MSHPVHGRVTGLQSLVLGLAGVDGSNSAEASSDDELVAAMRDCRKLLMKIADVDFGYDLKTWHEFLLSHAKLHAEYTNSYAWDSVSVEIRGRFANPERVRLARIAAGEGGQAANRPAPRE